MTQTVVVSAGTYHLPFDRLVTWMEPWVARHPAVHVVMQHGPSKPLAGAENHTVLPYPRLMALCGAADAIVLQGGAGGVMDMRSLARIPIVVPRIPVGNEVVDDHQLIFTNKAAELGVIHRAVTKEQLWQHLDAAINGTLLTRINVALATPGVANIARLLTVLPAAGSPGTRSRRLLRSAMGAVRRR